MPNYAFICDYCNENFEFHLSVDERNKLINCPACPGGQLIRIIVPTAVHFKGSGFYSTGG